MKQFLLFSMAIAFLFLLFLTGCSPQERSGVNPKPFNTPADWENRPYGTDHR